MSAITPETLAAFIRSNGQDIGPSEKGRSRAKLTMHLPDGTSLFLQAYGPEGTSDNAKPSAAQAVAPVKKTRRVKIQDVPSVGAPAAPVAASAPVAAPASGIAALLAKLSPDDIAALRALSAAVK